MMTRTSLRALNIAVCALALLFTAHLLVQPAYAQSTEDVTPRFTLGVGPALLSTIDASSYGSYQTYGVGAQAHMRLHSRLSLGFTGGFFRPTDHRVQSSFTRSNFTRRVLTGTLRANVEAYQTDHVRLYGTAGIAVHHAERSGEVVRFNDAPPYGTDTVPISETATYWGPQVGAGLALTRIRGVQVYMEPTFTALLPDADNTGRFQLDVGVRLPLR